MDFIGPSNNTRRERGGNVIPTLPRNRLGMDQTGFDILAQSMNPPPCLWLHLCSLFHSSPPFAVCSYMHSMLPWMCAHVRLCNSTYSACLDLPMHLRLNMAGYIWTRMRVSVQNAPPHLYAYTQSCTAGHKHCQ